jgi:hypothetical protein
MLVGPRAKLKIEVQPWPFEWLLGKAPPPPPKEAKAGININRVEPSVDLGRNENRWRQQQFSNKVIKHT